MQKENSIAGCSCAQCVSACKNDPGRLVPADMPALAAFLRMTVDELVAACLVKIPLSAKDKVYALAPVKRKGKRFLADPGTVVPDYYTSEKGVCVFLDDNGLCTVHEVKPFECGAYMGCRNSFLGKPYREKQVEEYFMQKWKKFHHS